MGKLAEEWKQLLRPSRNAICSNTLLQRGATYGTETERNLATTYHLPQVHKVYNMNQFKVRVKIWSAGGHISAKASFSSDIPYIYFISWSLFSIPSHHFLKGCFPKAEMHCVIRSIPRFSNATINKYRGRNEKKKKFQAIKCEWQGSYLGHT